MRYLEKSYFFVSYYNMAVLAANIRGDNIKNRRKKNGLKNINVQHVITGLSSLYVFSYTTPDSYVITTIFKV